MGSRAGQSPGSANCARARKPGRAEVGPRQFNEFPHSTLSQAEGDDTMTPGFDQPLYVLPFDHRGSFQTKMFGWKGTLSSEQTAQIAAAKRVIYDGFLAAVADGVPREKAGILVDEQFEAAILYDATRQGIGHLPG